jgi:hypothetical protein
MDRVFLCRRARCARAPASSVAARLRRARVRPLRLRFTRRSPEAAASLRLLPIVFWLKTPWGPCAMGRAHIHPGARHTPRTAPSPQPRGAVTVLPTKNASCAWLGQQSARQFCCPVASRTAAQRLTAGAPAATTVRCALRHSRQRWRPLRSGHMIRRWCAVRAARTMVSGAAFHTRPRAGVAHAALKRASPPAAARAALHCRACRDTLTKKRSRGCVPRLPVARACERVCNACCMCHMHLCCDK